MKMKNKKTFTRKKSPEQKEAELIMEELEKERMIHALEVEDVPIRLSAQLNDSGDLVHMTTTNKTKYVICTVESDGLEIFDMIDNDVHNLIKNAKECYAEYARMRVKYIDRGLKIMEKKNIPDEVCFSLDMARDYLNLQDMKAFYDEFNDDDLDDDFED